MYRYAVVSWSFCHKWLVLLFGKQEAWCLSVFHLHVNIGYLISQLFQQQFTGFFPLNQSCFIMFSFFLKTNPSTMKSLESEAVQFCHFSAVNISRGSNETALAPSQLTENNTPIMPITVSNYNESWNKILHPDCEKNQQKKGMKTNYYLFFSIWEWMLNNHYIPVIWLPRSFIKTTIKIREQNEVI